MYSISQKEVLIFMDSQLKRGMLENCILKSLEKEDSYGYKIIKDVSPYIKISESTLYPILKRLENSGFLSVYSVEHNSRLRKYYKLTECGSKKLSQFIDEWENVMKIYEFIRGEEHE